MKSINNETNFQSAQSSETVESVPQNSRIDTAQNEVKGSDGGVLFIPFGFVIVAWLLVFVTRLNFWKTVNGRILPSKKFTKSPCLNCRFYQNNPYIKCAVHPSKVMSKEATDCPDYWSQDEKKFSQ